MLPGSIGLRFHKSKPWEMAEENDFIRTYISLAKEHQGVFRVSTSLLAYTLKISPFQLPKMLYAL